MFIAMNRFQVICGQEQLFEEVWRTREKNLTHFEGYIEFKLLKGNVKDGKRLYSSHVLWESEHHFNEWTMSAEFKESHSKKRMPEGVLAGPPHFEGFEVILNEVK